MSERFEVVGGEVPSGGGGVTSRYSIHDKEKNLPVAKTFRGGSELSFLWKDHADCFCAALNLGWESIRPLEDLDKYHGCHDCGEERIPKVLYGRKLCPECDSENLVCIEE